MRTAIRKTIATLAAVTAILVVGNRHARAAVPERSGLTPAWKTSPAVPGVKCETLRVPMRDGTLLSTDVYLPTKPGTYPVLMERNPYRALGGGCFLGFELLFGSYAEQGYADVAQTVRGTITSNGTFDPFTQEVHDTYDAVEWAAAQNWSTGRVGMTSGSYLGIDQWMGAIASPPHLYAINPDIASSDPHDNPVYENGVFRLSDVLQYGGSFVPDNLTRYGYLKGLSAAQIAQEITSFETYYTANLTDWTNAVPLDALSVYRPYVESHFYDTWLNHPNYDAYWNAQDTETHFQDIKVPALVGGASDDLFNIGAIRNYQGMQRAAGTEVARRGTKLYWQAYGHAGDSGTPTFGNDAVPWAASLTGEQLAFFDHYLKGLDNGYESAPGAYLYVLVPPNSGEVGSGFWLNAASFPLPGTKFERYYLGSNGHANSRLGDGYIVSSDTRERNEYSRVGPSEDQFTYDPSNPVPTVGGNLLTADSLRQTKGFMDQSTVELRKDILVYTSAPLTKDLAVIGTVDASFWAMTSAHDTDFTVKLVDVHPDGLTHNVVDRIIRSRFRPGSKLPPSFVAPNTPYQYELQVGNTSSIFPAGHRIRVEISSSNFPKFERNSNTTQAGQLQGQFEVAHQTVLHDFAHPAFIELPVAPGNLPRSSR